jgi:chromosome partitioning protein
MRTWAVVSQKGGSGKTTLLLHIAIAAAAKGLAVSVLDLDPQRSAEQWSELRERRVKTDEPTVVHGAPADLDGMLEAAGETGTDLVLIDTPPSVDKSLIYAAAAADVVIVPTRSGVLDQFALKETLDYLVRIHALGKTVVVRNAPGRDVKANAEIERITRDFGVATLAVTIEDQVDLAASLREGKGVTESAPKRKSAKAIHELYQQLNAFERRLARTRKQVTA